MNAKPQAAQASIKQPVPHDAVERGESVFQADFLAFLVGAARIANWHFVDAPRRVAMLGNLGGNLWLKTETIRFKADVGQHLAAENLVARLHVREVEVRE